MLIYLWYNLFGDDMNILIRNLDCNNNIETFEKYEIKLIKYHQHKKNKNSIYNGVIYG